MLQSKFKGARDGCNFEIQYLSLILSMGQDNANNWWRFRYRNVFQYGISPFYQKAVLNDFAYESKKLLIHSTKNVLAFVPFGLGAIGLVMWANADHKKRHRKAYHHHESGHVTAAES